MGLIEAATSQMTSVAETLVPSESIEESLSLFLDTLSGWFRQANISHPKGKARLFLAMLYGVALHYLCIYQQYPLNTMKPRLLQAARDICRANE